MENKDSKKENNNQPKSGSERLSAEIDLLKAGVADDLEMIREGKEGVGGKNLKYISFDKGGDKFNRVKILLETIKLFEETSKGGRPKKVSSEKEEDVEITKEQEPKVAPKEQGNVFELVSKQLLEKRVNGK